MSGFQFFVCAWVSFSLVTRAWLISNYEVLPLQENPRLKEHFTKSEPWLLCSERDHYEALATIAKQDHAGSASSGYVAKNSDLFFPGHPIWPAAVWRNLEVISQPYFTPLHLIGGKKTHKRKDEQAFMIMSSSAPSFKRFCGFWVVIYNLELNRPIIPSVHLEKLITDSALLLWLRGGNSNHITIGRQYYFLTWL